VKGDLRHGVVVEVRSETEILATLDKEGALDALPFMPEMLQYLGRRFVVYGRAEKICDTIKTYTSRKMSNTVILEDLRCDGSAHDGCQSECRLFWKESWLRRVVPDASAGADHKVGNDSTALEEITAKNSLQSLRTGEQQEKIFRCQATELYKASTPLSVWDPRPYFHEFTNGNVPLARFIRVFTRAFTETLLLKIRRIILYRILGRSDRWIPFPGTRIGPPTNEPLDLKPGDWVQVKTREEIASSVTPEGKDRGLSFDREMVPHCGKIHRVRQRVNRFIDDRTGQMIELKNDCVTLDGAVCSGDRSVYRYFCPRGIYPFWRENWLRRVEVDMPGSSHGMIDKDALTEKSLPS